MRKHKPLAKMYFVFFVFCLSASLAHAQDLKPVAKKAEKKEPPEKIVPNATLNLQTTVTGNQEQPRVLYILPWQSPEADDVDFESIDNEEKAVFGHVERDEFRRELESAGE